MNRTVSVDNLLNAFPISLKSDAKQNALSESTAEELIKLWNDNHLLALYTRIFELDESLLDILAHDFKVDWYLYDGSLDSKRHQISSLFYVHKHLGTRKAMETALSDICPGSAVEEWFEYNGKPYYFRVIVDVTEQRTVISLGAAEHMIEIFKPVRSRLEGGAIAFRTRCTILVSCVGNYAYITDRICGTYPRRAMQGRISEDVILVSEKGTSAGFYAPPAGSILAGTFPRPAVQGKIAQDVILLSEDGNVSGFYSPPAGSIEAGTYPYPKWRGVMDSEEILISAEDANSNISARKAGTYPHTAQQGKVLKGSIEVTPSASESNMSVPKTGTVPYAAIKGTTGAVSVDASAQTDSAAIIAHKAGSPPDVNAGDGNISFDSDGGSATYITRPCGKPFGLF